jgi:hypothetical protein
MSISQINPTIIHNSSSVLANSLYYLFPSQTIITYFDPDSCLETTLNYTESMTPTICINQRAKDNELYYVFASRYDPNLNQWINWDLSYLTGNKYDPMVIANNEIIICLNSLIDKIRSLIVTQLDNEEQFGLEELRLAVEKAQKNNLK